MRRRLHLISGFALALCLAGRVPYERSKSKLFARLPDRR